MYFLLHSDNALLDFAMKDRDLKNYNVLKLHKWNKQRWWRRASKADNWTKTKGIDCVYFSAKIFNRSSVVSL